MKKILASALMLLTATAAMADKPFESTFADSTLRVDFIFSGTNDKTDVALRRMSRHKGWSGRRVNLSTPVWHGNGQVSLVDSLSGDTIYRQSFSSLFQEWQGTQEASERHDAFEDSRNLPLPRRAAYVVLDLYNSRRERVATSRTLYRPDDILVADRSGIKPPKYTTVHSASDPTRPINVAIVGEGFTKKEMGNFRKYARRTVDAIFSHEPFKSRKDLFNFVAVELPSEESGVSVPHEGRWVRTPLSAHYDTFYSPRYLTTGNIFDLYDRLTGVPYEHIIILANSPVYGGGGIYNTYTITTTDNPKFAPVVVHEFGHSFGGLADEYFYETDVMNDTYPTDVEPWEPNITTLVDFDSKWKPLLDPSAPVPTPNEAPTAAPRGGAPHPPVPADWEQSPLGVYEGAAYSSRGIYRPLDRCRMRDNDWPAFCPACRRAIDTVILHNTTQR